MRKAKAVSPQTGRFPDLSSPPPLIGTRYAFLSQESEPQDVCTETSPTVLFVGKRMMTMTITAMNRLLGAVAVGLVVAGGNIAADASVRLPAEHMSGMPSLAPLLRQVKEAVVTVAIPGLSLPETNSSLNNTQRPLRPPYTRP